MVWLKGLVEISELFKVGQIREWEWWLGGLWKRPLVIQKVATVNWGEVFLGML